MAKRGRPRKTKAVKPIVEPIVVPEINPPQLNPTIIQDRIMRYRRNAPCPECQSHPVVCIMRKLNYAAFRCRECGYRWEVG